jgi:hypothetical protein
MTVRRQDLNKDFTKQATRCYFDALRHNEPDLSTLGSLNAMRRASHQPVSDKVETPFFTAEGEITGRLD